jgi:hypothetical protein
MNRFKHLMILVAALLLAAGTPIYAKPNIYNLAHQCNDLKKQNACRELAKLAEQDKDPAVRADAISELADQSLLAKIALQEENQHARERAVRKLADQSLLARVALEDKDVHVREAAAEKLTDQPSLAKVVGETKDANIRNLALRSLKDQALLESIALQNDDKTARTAAVAKLIEQPLLAKVVVETKDADVRDLAIRSLTDQALLSKIAQGQSADAIRAAAVRKLTDQALLSKIAVQDKDQAVRRAAVERLTDEALLAKLAVDDKDAQVRATATGKLADPSLLAKIAADDRDDSVRTTAQQRLRTQQAEAAVHSALIAVFRQAGIHILEWPTDNDPIRKAAAATTSGVLYLSSYGMVEAKFLNLTPAMAAYLEGKDGLACINGEGVSFEQFSRSFLGKGIIAFYLNLARTPDNKEDWNNRRMAMVKLSDQVALPAVDPMSKVDASFWVALIGSCQRIRSGAYLGPGK